ncbi:MAG: hypothetical protein ACLFTD_04650 [Halochromatium sp.]
MSPVLFPVSGVETWPWLPPLAALIIAFFTSMVGISGAFLLVPFQLSVLGFASPAASADWPVPFSVPESSLGFHSSCFAASWRCSCSLWRCAICGRRA